MTTPPATARGGPFVGGAGDLEEGPRDTLSAAQVRGATQRGASRSVRTSSDEHPYALEGGGVLGANPRPFRFKLEDADVRASNLERGNHDSQLH